MSLYLYVMSGCVVFNSSQAVHRIRIHGGVWWIVHCLRAFREDDNHSKHWFSTFIPLILLMMMMTMMMTQLMMMQYPLRFQQLSRHLSARWSLFVYKPASERATNNDLNKQWYRQLSRIQLEWIARSHDHTMSLEFEDSNHLSQMVPRKNYRPSGEREREQCNNGHSVWQGGW